MIEALEQNPLRFPQGFVRLSPKPIDTIDELGPLADLAGTWFGSRGWNLIAVPQGERGFLLLVRPYIEVITFTPIGALVPNRGGAAGTMLVPGLHYDLKVTDAETNQPLHIENGMWLLLEDPQSGARHVARLASVPHGDSVLSLGNFSTTPGAPSISNASAMPITGGEPPLGYLDPYLTLKGFDPQNYNATLQQTIAGQNIEQTTTLAISTVPDGGILNIPFIVRHADAKQFDCFFWIEKVKDGATGAEFLQLQYSQRTDLHFLPQFDDPAKRIIWPHVNVNTLLKQ